MPKFDMVAFDCDGVLVDSEPITCGVLADMLNELGWKVSLEDTMRIFVGRLVRDEAATIAANISKPMPSDFYLQFVERRNRALEAGIDPVRGIREAVARLAEREMPFCVASGADRAKMHLTLGQTGLLPWFEKNMFSGMEVPRTKPAPDVYLLAAKTMGIDPSRCVVIEDTPTGIAAGLAAGMTVYGYAERTDPQRLLDAGASKVFSDMALLPQLVLE
ncbi:HAD family hydrolase [Noviherbaspirillum aerium]|uniref:HAD family hydrolase n=1 Tax=Noviherbaspirillum aerium TaxID=2588497 RepID=UPI00124BDF30|nr:HAD family phosphatase [Noviherbaspirillum aerium]